MFTGIIQSIGQVIDKQKVSGDYQFKIKTNFSKPEQIKLGDSIAMDGVCLTVTDICNDTVTVDVSVETVNKTTVELWQTGSQINLEPAMSLQDQLGGHIVSGHVDAVGQCIKRETSARSEVFKFEVPQQLSQYMVTKGSVAINGVSLTVNAVNDNIISINLVPHTLQHTNLDQLQPGSKVNIEVDTIARYVEKMLNPHMTRG
ncbi:MAG: riboflavin synthase [Xanthomonadales bacterium]|nr:riboflavin synthase [Xanthomonadales bacterium]